MFNIKIDGVSSETFGVRFKATEHPLLAQKQYQIKRVMGSDRTYRFEDGYQIKELGLILIYASKDSFIKRRKNARDIAKWLTGQKLVLDYEPYLEYDIIGVEGVSVLISHPSFEEYELEFNVQPIQYSRFKNGEMIINQVDIPINLLDMPINQSKNEFLIKSGAVNLVNYGTYKTKPIIVLSGVSSTVTLKLGDKSMTYTGLNGTVYIDCVDKIVHDGAINKRQNFSGDYFELDPGDNQVTVTSASKITVYFDFKNAYI